VLVGLAITAVWPGGWWIDPVIGLAVAAAAVWEGRSSATAAVTGGPDWGLRTVAPAKGPCLDPATVRSEKNCEPLRPRRQTMGGLVPARHLERTRRMTVSAETRAYWQELGGYYAAAERNGTDHTHPPKPPTADVAFDVSAICAPRASPC